MLQISRHINSNTVPRTPLRIGTKGGINYLSTAEVCASIYFVRVTVEKENNLTESEVRREHDFV